MLSKINQAIFSKKVTLKQLQSLCGRLAFCSRALPSGRAFSRRLYLATSKAKKPHHFIKITKDIFEDLMIWKQFIEKFNRTSYMLDDWISNVDLKLYTDSAGGASKGCGAYCQDKWVYLQWPLEWTDSEILKDITFLEIIPIALAIFLWYKLFHKKRIIFYIDNLAVVSILNSKSSKRVKIINLDNLIIENDSIVFYSKSDNHLLYIDDNHLSEYGSRIMGDSLINLIDHISKNTELK